MQVWYPPGAPHYIGIPVLRWVSAVRAIASKFPKTDKNICLRKARAMNAVIYTRVSTEEQKKGYSLQTQLEHCLEYAKRLDFVVLETFQDSVSGEDLDRPGLNSLYDFITRNTVDIVIVYDPDRLSRGGPAHTAIIEMRLEKYNARLEYVLGDYNDNSPESALSLMIKQSIAWYENQQRRERVVRGRNGRARAGKVVTGVRTPFGYKYRDGELLVKDDEAAIVRDIYAAYLTGDSYSTIASDLCERSIPTRADTEDYLKKRNSYGVWSASSVGKILKNVTYTGKWYYNKTKTVKVDGKKRQVKRPRSEWIEVDVPAIIDQQTFEAAQAQRKANSTLAKRNTSRQYLVQGLLFCKCGMRCTARHTRNWLSYKCPTNPNHEWSRPCEVRFNISAKTIDDIVWNAVTDILLNPDYLKQEIERQRASSHDTLAVFEERLEAIHAAIDDTNRKIGILLDQMLNNDFPQAIIDERRNLLTDQLYRLQSEQQRVLAEHAKVAITDSEEDTLLQFAGTMRQSLEMAEFEQKRKILKILRVEVYAESLDQVRLTGLIPFRQELVDVRSIETTSL